MTVAKNQRQEILDLLIAARGGEVASPVLSRISLQYGARVLELRRMGFRIINRIERVDGKTHGYFRLDMGTVVAPREAAQNPSASSASDTLFPNQQPVRYIPGGGR